MFPHPLDRYRLLSRLVAAARETFPARCRARDPARRDAEANTQKAVADRTRGIAFQKHVSDLERLEVSLERRDRQVNRTRLTAVLHWGLELERDQIDALLWLYDGQPLTDDEVTYYRLGPALRHARGETLRDVVLDQLREMVNRQYGPMGSRPATVRMFSGDARGRHVATLAIHELEAVPGHQMFVAADPSRLTSPPAWLTSYQAPTPDDPSPALHASELSRNAARHTTFLQTLATSGARGIHSRAALARYASGERVDPFLRSPAQRRAHLRHWIALLETYEHYEVGLVEETPPLEMEIKSIVRALIRGAPPSYERQPPWGPTHILFEDALSVLQSYLAFETAWDAIPARDREKAHVIAWLSGLVSG